MDEHGNIYLLEKNPRKAEVIEEMKLVEIPEEELPRVYNLSEKDRIKWYREHKSVA